MIGITCVAAGCGGQDSTHHTKPPLGPAHLDPANFVATVDNPYFPLAPGTVWEYSVTSADGPERVVVTVLDETRVVDGVTATVVHDVVSEAPSGNLIEDTHDWYAQDKKGNVWYLGEDTKKYERQKVDTRGSWEAAVDGARPGLLMVAKPTVGRSYRQEYYKGEAEDRGKVVAIDEKVTGPTGSYENVVKTADTTRLEPGLIENKWYTKGVGIVQEADIKGGDEKVTLVKMTRP